MGVWKEACLTEILLYLSWLTAPQLWMRLQGPPLSLSLVWRQKAGSKPNAGLSQHPGGKKKFNSIQFYLCRFRFRASQRWQGKTPLDNIRIEFKREPILFCVTLGSEIMSHYSSMQLYAIKSNSTECAERILSTSIRASHWHPISPHSDVWYQH